MITFVRHYLSSHFLPEIIERKKIFSLRKKTRLAGLLLSLLVFAPGAVFGQDADLFLSAVADPVQPIAGGQQITFTVTVTNNGSIDGTEATGVEVDITFPAEILYDGFIGVGVSCSGLAIGSGGGTVTCELPNIPFVEDEDQSFEFEIFGETDINGTFPVGFVVTAATTDPDPDNNVETIALTVRAGADLEISITGDPTVMSGSTADYTVTIDNNGPNDASGITFTYPVPAGTIYTSGPGGCTAAPLNFGDTITCTVGSLNSGNSTSIGPFTFQAGIASGSDIIHTVTVSPDTPADPNTDNNTDSFVTDVTGGSDVAITKTRSGLSGNFVGETFNFVLTPTYTGDVPSTLEITDNIPAQYEIITASFDLNQNGWTCSAVGQLVTCTQASGTVAGVNVPLGIITIPVEIVDAGAGVTNTAEITSASPTDPDLSNNSASDSPITILFPATDFSITKSGPSPALVVQNVPFEYTITARNNGPGNFVGDLIVTDNLPSGLDVTAITLNGWACVSSNGDPAALNLPVSGTATITCERTYTEGSPLNANTNAPVITLTAETTIGTTGTPITNEAEISSANTPPGVDFTNVSGSGTNTVTTSTNPDSADLTLSKSVVGPDPVDSGEILTYRVELINNGDATAEDVVFTDPLPTLINTSTGPGNGFEGFTFDSGGAQYGVLVPADVNCSTTSSGGGRTLTCSIVTFPECTPGDNCPIIEIQVRPRIDDTGNRTNTASIVSTATADPNTGNNSASATSEVIAVADMTVTKSPNEPSVPIGQQLTYNIAAINNLGGPSYSNAQNVRILDQLPLDVVFVSATAAAGSCTTNPADGVANAVEITPGMTTTADSRTVQCSWPVVDRGAQRTAQIIVKPNFQLFADPDPEIINNVEVFTETEETDPDNNTASATVALTQPVLDLLILPIQRTRDGTEIQFATINDDDEEEVTFVIRIQNDGPSDATDIELITFMPSGLSFDAQGFSSSSPGVNTGCTEDPEGVVIGRSICTVDRLATGQFAVFEITGIAETKGTSTIHAFVRSNETDDETATNFNAPADFTSVSFTYDTDPLNNERDRTITVRTRVDLEFLSKVASASTVPVGANFNWVATLRNNTNAQAGATGLAEADDVVVTDNLPDGMELTGTPSVNVTVGTTTDASCTGVAGETSFTCNLGEVSNPAEIEFTIPVRVPEITTDPTVFNNTISVTTSSRDINTGNNSTTGPVTIEGANITGFVYRDFDNDGLLNNNDTGISGIEMTLTGTAFNGLPVSKATTTDGTGAFRFDGLPASDGASYTITRGTVSEAFLTVGQQTIDDASAGNGVTGVVGEISGIDIEAQTDNPTYLFGYIPQPRLGLAKQVRNGSNITPVDDGTDKSGSFIVDFRVVVQNYSLEPLEDITVTDILNGAAPRFGTYVVDSDALLLPNQYTIEAAPSFNGTCGTGGSVDASFTGSGNNTLASGISLNIAGEANDRCEIDFSIRYMPPTPLPTAPSYPYLNQATGAGVGSWTGTGVTDDSHNGTNPVPGCAPGTDTCNPASFDDETPVTLQPQADVESQVTLTGTSNGGVNADADTPVSGTVLYRNNGPNIAENVNYTLQFTSGLQNLDFGNLPANVTMSYNSGTGVVTISGAGVPTSLNVGQIFSGDGINPITFTYTQPGPATSTVESGIATTTTEPNPPGTTNNPDSATITGDPIADVATTVNFTGPIDSGQPVSGTVTYQNNGPSAAEGVVYQLTLSSGLEAFGHNVTFDFSGSIAPGASATYNNANGVVTFSSMPATLAIGDVLTFTVNYVQPGVPSSNIDGLLSSVESEISTTTREDILTNNTDEASLDGDFIADVTTRINDFPADADAGDPVSGRVIFTNIGPSEAEGVTYSVTLEPNLLALGTVEISNLPPGATASYDNDTGLVTFTNMPPSLDPDQIAAGDPTGILIEYTQPAPGESVVRSEIQTTTREPAVHEPNTAIVQVGGDPLAEVETVISLAGSGNAGTTVTATVLYRNNGPSEAEGVTYELIMTENLTNVEFSNLPSGASATYDPATGIVTFTSMPTELDRNEIASGNGTSGIIVTYTQPGDAFSEAESRIATTTDELTPPGITNNESIDDISGILIADVTTSLDFPPVVDALTMVNGTVVYRNEGPSIASDVTYSLTLLPDLEDVSFGNLPPGATATYNPGTGIVTFTGMPPTLGIGEMASGDGTNGIEINYRQPAAGESEVDSEIGTSTDQGENILPDTARVELDGRVADVTTEITISPEANAGETVTGTVLFENRGPSTASDVTYTLTFEPELENLVISNLPAGATATYDPATGEITFTGMPTTLVADQIASGNGTDPLSFSYTQPGSASSEVNSTIGTSTNQGANIAPDDAVAEVTGVLIVDVTTEVTLTGVPGEEGNAGTLIEGTLLYTNAGPSTAFDVNYVLTLSPDVRNLEFSNLPSGVTFSYNVTSGVVTFTGMPDQIAMDAIVSGDGTNPITFSYLQPGTGESSAVSEISTSTDQGANALPDEDTATIEGEFVADVTTTVNAPALVNSGQIVSARVIYTNLGPSTALGVTFGLQLRSGLEELGPVTFGNLPDGVTAVYNNETGEVVLTGMPETVLMDQIVSGDGVNGIEVTYTQPGDELPGTSTTPPTLSDIVSTITTTTLEPDGHAPNSDSAVVAGEFVADVTTTHEGFPLEDVDAGTPVSGRIIFTNVGPSVAEGVTYRLILDPNLEDLGPVTFDNLPAGATAVYDNETGEVVLSGMPNQLGVDEIASGDGVEGIEINYIQPGPAISTIRSEIETTTQEPDPHLPNIAVTQPGGGVVTDVTTTVHFPPNADAGEPVEGRVFFRNNGPSLAEDVTYRLEMTPGLTGVSFGNLPAGATATYNPETGVVTFSGMPNELEMNQIASGDGQTGIIVRYTQPGEAVSEIKSIIGTSTNQGLNIAPDEAEAVVTGGLIADLGIEKLTNRNRVTTGSEIIYTIRVDNYGPSPVPSGSTIEDVPEGVSFNSVSCTAEAENQCAVAPNLEALRNGLLILPALPSGGFYEFEVRATVVREEGSVRNSVQVNAPPNVEDPNPNNNRSSVTNVIENIPLIGLAKQATSLEVLESFGYRQTFTVVVQNLGNEDLTDVVITDPLSSRENGHFGTHMPSGELATGSYRVSEVTANGLTANQEFNGDSDLVLATGSLEIGERATIRFAVEFRPDPEKGAITNQVLGSATGVGSGIPTEDVSHDGLNPLGDGCSVPLECVEPTPILVPTIGVTKQVAETVNLQNGRYDVTFSIGVFNMGVTELNRVQVTDDLTSFGSFTTEEMPGPGEYTVIQSPEQVSAVSGANLTVRDTGDFNGEDQPALLNADLSSLPNGIPDASSAVLEFTIRFFPLHEGPYLNTAVATGVGPAGQTTRDESVDASEPDLDESIPTEIFVGPQVIGAAKEADEPVQSGLRSFLVTYRVIIANLSESVTATYVQLSDDLTQTFPTAQSITIEKPATILECTGTELELADPMFDGVEQIQFLRGDQHLQPGEQCTIEFSVEVDYGEGDVPTEPKLNQAIATTHGSPGGDVIAIGRSDDGDIPAPDGEKTPVVFEPADPTLDGGLIVVKTSSLLNVTVGQMVPFTIQVTNPNPFRFENVELRDLLPPGFQYRTGTATVDGLAVEPTINGRSLSWAGLVIAPEQTITIRLILVVGAGVQPGEYTNIAQAFDDRTPPGDEDRPLSEVGSASVRVVPDPIFDCADIIGKVFLDNNRNNRQTTGENGLANVRIATARGWLVTTDADGKFSIACAAYPDPQRGSNFILKLDESSLPEGYTVVSENPRTVRVTAGKVTEANFGVAAPANLRIEISANAFAAGSRDLLPDWKSHLEQLEDELPDRPILLQIIYRNHGEAQELPRERVESIMRFINENWSRSSLNRIVSMEEVIQNHE